MGVDPAFWRGKRVLLTGHTGFKGSWLALWLQRLEADVLGYSISVPTTPSLYEDAEVGASMVSIEGDVRDPKRLGDALREHCPEIVIHMAAQALVLRSLGDPVETYETNVLGTVYLLEAVRHTPDVRVVVNVTSDKCYENREWPWPYRESEPMGGRDPYSSSKGCSELVTSAYRASFFSSESGTRVASARAGNVIGGGDWAGDRLVPDLMRGALRGEVVRIRNPSAVRPWQHVLNPLNGYLQLAQRLWDEPSYADAWNFGPGDDSARSVEWVVERLTELWGDGLRTQADPGSGGREALSLRVDSSKARASLGWSPVWDLDDGLRATVDWYKAYEAKRGLREVVDDQIASFERSLA
ncbi:MAG: CDP-glucose 4,6-dehydratase [Gaiellaceae bacterium]